MFVGTNFDGVKTIPEECTLAPPFSVEVTIDKHAEATVADNSKSIELNTASQSKWTVPKPFRDEPILKRAELMLKWILGDENFENILNGTKKITNITVLLNNMKYNGYLRLFGLDLDIMKIYITESSFILLQDFKLKHKEDKWICPQCQSFLEKQCRWQCDRCLFWHHEKCSQPKDMRSPCSNYRLCLACFFIL